MAAEAVPAFRTQEPGHVTVRRERPAVKPAKTRALGVWTVRLARADWPELGEYLDVTVKRQGVSWRGHPAVGVVASVAAAAASAAPAADGAAAVAVSVPPLTVAEMYATSAILASALDNASGERSALAGPLRELQKQWDKFAGVRGAPSEREAAMRGVPYSGSVRDL